MVVTYLVILTVAVAYLGLRLWSAEQYLDQIPKTIESFANTCDNLEERLNKLTSLNKAYYDYLDRATVALGLRILAIENAAKKPRGKK